MVTPKAIPSSASKFVKSDGVDVRLSLGASHAGVSLVRSTNTYAQSAIRALDLVGTVSEMIYQ
jgi:hypothetical protein